MSFFILQKIHQINDNFHHSDPKLTIKMCHIVSHDFNQTVKVRAALVSWEVTGVWVLEVGQKIVALCIFGEHLNDLEDGGDQFAFEGFGLALVGDFQAECEDGLRGSFEAVEFWLREFGEEDVVGLYLEEADFDELDDLPDIFFPEDELRLLLVQLGNLRAFFPHGM